MLFCKFLWIVSIALVKHFHSASGLDCYQCDSNIDLECSEIFDADSTKLRPQPCDDVFEARFCIKTTGMYAGRIGTTRNCSSRDLGDRCSYLKRYGDKRYVRSCVYTCSTDGCNGINDLHDPESLQILSIIITNIIITIALF